LTHATKIAEALKTQLEIKIAAKTGAGGTSYLDL